jgi:SEFIR domain
LEASLSKSGSDLPLENRRPTVFISYSHDSPDHGARVLELANRLCDEGVDATIDQYEQEPREGWPLWTEKLILQADFVLMVCTETYLRRVTKNEVIGKGLGATWEAHLIYQLIYENGLRNDKFLAILFQDGKTEHIPTPLRSFTHYRLTDEEGYLNLYRRLTRQPSVVKPTVGSLRKMPLNQSAGGKEAKHVFQSELTEEQRAAMKRNISRQKSIIWEAITSRAEKIVEEYNKKHQYRFIKALNLVYEKTSAHSEMSIIMSYPEERSFRLKFKFNEALLEFSYRAIDMSPGVVDIVLNDFREFRFRLNGDEFSVDELLKKIIAPLLINQDS